MELYDLLLANKINGGGGGGSSVSVEPLSVTQNGTYSETGKAYSPVNVSVPNTYSASDEGKVVSNGALVAQSSQTIDSNGTYDTTLKNSVTVNVSGGGDDSFQKLIDGSITTANIPSGTTKIRANAFADCANLTSVSIPEGVTELGLRSFAGCGLTSVTIPSTVTDIKTYVFITCNKLTSVTILAATPPTLGGTNAFPNTVTAIYVPAASVDTYKGASTWSSLASKIQAIPS